MIVNRDFPKNAIDGNPPPIDVDLPPFAKVPRPDQPHRVHLSAEIGPASFPKEEVLTPDLRCDGLNDVHDILPIKSSYKAGVHFSIKNFWNCPLLLISLTTARLPPPF